MNDEQYNDFIKKQLDENEEAHFSDVEHNKKRTWNLIEHRLKKKRIIPIWFYSAAAYIILLFGIGFLFNSEINDKNAEIAGLNQRIAKLEKQNVVKKVKIVTKTDTIRLVKDKLVYIPVIKHNTIIEHDTVIKLITQNDTVFIKDVIPELIAENKTLKSKNIVFNHDVITGNQIKKRKKKRFVFRFGIPGNNKGDRVQKESLISLKTELK